MPARVVDPAGEAARRRQVVAIIEVARLGCNCRRKRLDRSLMVSQPGENAADGIERQRVAGRQRHGLARGIRSFAIAPQQDQQLAPAAPDVPLAARVRPRLRSAELPWRSGRLRRPPSPAGRTPWAARGLRRSGLRRRRRPAGRRAGGAALAARRASLRPSWLIWLVDASSRTWVATKSAAEHAVLLSLANVASEIRPRSPARKPNRGTGGPRELSCWKPAASAGTSRAIRDSIWARMSATTSVRHSCLRAQSRVTLDGDRHTPRAASSMRMARRCCPRGREDRAR